MRTLKQVGIWMIGVILTAIITVFMFGLGIIGISVEIEKHIFYGTDMSMIMAVLWVCTTVLAIYAPIRCGLTLTYLRSKLVK